MVVHERCLSPEYRKRAEGRARSLGNNRDWPERVRRWEKDGEAKALKTRGRT